ncbi:MAG: hypothetical protein ACRC8S_12840 [Fimbriiglobus sp.]
MSLLNKGRLEIKLGEYAVGAATVLADPLLVTRTQDYRRQVAGRMVPLEPDYITKRFPNAEYHVSLKVDGEFNMLVYEAGETLLVNPGGTVRTGLPLLKEAADLLKAAGLKKAMIPGELYYSAGKSKRPRIHDVCQVARQPSSQAELDGLHFAAFDILEADDFKSGGPYAATLKKLEELFKKGKKCSVVETMVLKDAEGIAKQHKKWIDAGAEGAVVRSETVGTFKIKTRHTIDAVVIGFTEGTDDRVGMIHDLLLAVMRPEGTLHVLGHVGGGFTTEDRRGFLSDLKDLVVGSDYVEVNDQVAYRMVKPEWVVEISILEMITQTTRGQALKTMVINWNKDSQRYEVIRRMPLVSLTSPQFVRRREDKQVNVTDIRLQQVADLVEVSLVDRDSRQLAQTPSTLIRREVRTKELKGATMVRKLVMWQTNKDIDNEDYPAFVIHSTDFSPNRKTPLEREVRVSSSKDQIEQLWTELAEEYFTKGWNAVDSTTVVKPKPPEGEAPAPKKAASKKAASESDLVEEAPAGEAPAPKKKAASKTTKKAASESDLVEEAPAPAESTAVTKPKAPRKKKAE